MCCFLGSFEHLFPLIIGCCKSLHKHFLLCWLLSCRLFLLPGSPSLPSLASIWRWLPEWISKISLICWPWDIGCLEPTWVMSNVEISSISITYILECRSILGGCCKVCTLACVIVLGWLWEDSLSFLTHSSIVLEDVVIPPLSIWSVVDVFRVECTVELI